MCIKKIIKNGLETSWVFQFGFSFQLGLRECMLRMTGVTLDMPSRPTPWIYTTWTALPHLIHSTHQSVIWSHHTHGTPASPPPLSLPTISLVPECGRDKFWKRQRSTSFFTVCASAPTVRPSAFTYSPQTIFFTCPPYWPLLTSFHPVTIIHPTCTFLKRTKKLPSLNIHRPSPGCVQSATS